MINPSVLEPTDPQGSVLIAGVGASQGLGAAIARRFAAGGYPVAIAGRNAEKLAATAAELAAGGAKVAHVVGDVARPADVARFVATAKELGPLAMAVQNAGSNRWGPFLETTGAEFEAHWREHALGGFHLAQAVIPERAARCAARPSSPPLPQPRPRCARYRKALRGSSVRKASMSATSSSTAGSRATG
jgi:NAD(P)-dependent dehydrogenase (short-subunit alcohol dehydrogenase family)